jgi:hypothetical protein
MPNAQPPLGPDQEPPNRRTAIMAIVAIVLLVLGGVWLANVMHANSRLEDCLMQGRRNCAPVSATP